MNPTAVKKTHGRLGKTAVRIAQNKHLYILLLPTIAFYIIYCYIPMFGNIMAFQDYNVAQGISGSKWVGLEHFRDFLTDYYFWRLLRNTLSINILGLIFSFPAPILLALLLNEIRCEGYKKSIQVITYMPHFISMVVIAAMVLDFVSADGIINSIRAALGLEKIMFMTDPDNFYPIYIISDIWQSVGWGSIIYIAAMSGVDQQLYEAAIVDGAGRFRLVWSITIPSILPTIMILLILRIGQMLDVGFEKIMLLYNETIYEKADVISTYVYRRGIREMEYSYSTAVGLFNSVVNFLLLIFANRASRKLTDSGLW